MDSRDVADIKILFTHSIALRGYVPGGKPPAPHSRTLTHDP